MAPTYVVGSRGRCPTAIVARTFLFHPPPGLSLLDTSDKRSLRAAARAARAAVPEATAEAFGQRLARLGPQLVRGAMAETSGVVACYSAMGDEVRTWPLMDALHEAGFTLALPVTGAAGTPLTFRRWTPGTITVPGRLAIPEPPAEAQVLTPDILFVPLTAFDRRGHRLGAGAGFYDRTLARLRGRGEVTAIGLGYAAQEVLYIPDEDYDEPLDLVVTETETLVIADGA